MKTPWIRSGLWAFAVSLAFPALAGPVYKWQDENGVTHYSNLRPAEGSRYVTLDFPCYASDPACRRIDWASVPLDTRAFAAEIQRAASAHAVDEALIRAVIHAESAYQPDAVSPRGARGLMQLMPETMAELQVSNVFHPDSNIDGGTSYLAQMLSEFGGDVELATAAYNAGPGAVHNHGGVPPYPETREYVRRVLILYRRYRGADT